MRAAFVLLLAAAADPTTKADNWYLAVGHGGHRMLSRDGVTWEKHQSWGEPKHDQNDLNLAVNYKGTFVAGGGYFSGRVAATRDGEKWSDGVIPGSSPIFGLEVVGDTLYAVDLRGKVFATTDVTNWKLVATPVMPPPTEVMWAAAKKLAKERGRDEKTVTESQANGHWIRASCQGNGLIVSSGDYGPCTAFDPKTGKVTVTAMAGQVDKQPGLKRVAFGNGVFVCGGQNGLLAVSKDGTTWESNKVNPDRGDINCVEFTGKEFVATSKNGNLHSADGKAWEPLQPATPRQVRLVNGVLFGYDSSSKFRRSTDGGLTWKDVPNEKGWQGKNYAFGPLAGGDPPALPQPKK